MYIEFTLLIRNESAKYPAPSSVIILLHNISSLIDFKNNIKIIR